MSVVVSLSIIAACLAGAAVYALFRQRAWVAMLAGGLVFAGLLAWFLHPVCVPIAESDLAQFDPPIETRNDTDMTGQRYFQRHGGRWHHCKAWIERQLFF